jgi:hypothetical protein
MLVPYAAPSTQQMLAQCVAWRIHNVPAQRAHLPDATCLLLWLMACTFLYCSAAALKFYLYSQLEYITAAMLSKYVPTGEPVKMCFCIMGSRFQGITALGLTSAFCASWCPITRRQASMLYQWLRRLYCWQCCVF